MGKTFKPHHLQQFLAYFGEKWLILNLGLRPKNWQNQILKFLSKASVMRIKKAHFFRVSRTYMKNAFLVF